MKISEEKYFVFVHVAKAAGTSISTLVTPYCIAERKNNLLKVLSKSGIVPNWRWHHYRIHEPLRTVEKRIPKDLYDGLVKFAVVRNPWDRLVSMYHYKKQGHGRQLGMIKKLGTFSNWLRWMGDLPHSSPYKLQVNMLKQHDGIIGVNHILRFESLSEQWNDFSKVIGVEEQLPKLNTSNHNNWREYYSKEDADYVASIWQEDIDTLEYQFEMPS
jgi:hypothetical protein